MFRLEGQHLRRIEPVFAKYAALAVAYGDDSGTLAKEGLCGNGADIPESLDRYPRTGQVLLLPLIGLVFVMETGSVILQIVSVKLRDKRIFKMSPLHHHFELSGWDEEKITLRFWIIGALSALIGVAFYMATVGLLN